MRNRFLGKVNSSIGKVLTLFFVVLYVAGTTHIEWVHSFVHEHANGVLHSSEEEKDPCHRSIYHSDVEHGCHHDSHLIVSDKCKMCDLIFHRDYVFSPSAFFLKEEFSTQHFTAYKESIERYWAVISSSRAPPITI